MAKNDIMAAFNNETVKIGAKDKKKISDTASYFAGSSIFEGLPAVQDQAIPLDQIEPRAINEFSDVKFSQLEFSIQTYGLIQPIIVVKYPDNPKYVISSGHRRYNAVVSLHNQYPEDERFKTIQCCIYEVTEDPILLASDNRYITPEQEEGIYRDTNLQTRQLKYEDVAKQIRYILTRIEDPAYLEKARELLKEEYGTRLVYKDGVSRQKLIMSVLASQNYQGWSSEKIRQYLVIRDQGDDSLIQRIENGEPVYSIYKQIVKPRKREKSVKTILSNISVNLDDLKKVVKDKELNASERKQLRKILEDLNSIDLD